MAGNQTEIPAWNSTKASVDCPVAFAQGAEYEGYVRSSGMWCHAVWYMGIKSGGKSDASIFIVEDASSSLLRNAGIYLPNQSTPHIGRDQPLNIIGALKYISVH
jgi:hypothetical protein